MVYKPYPLEVRAGGTAVTTLGNSSAVVTNNTGSVTPVSGSTSTVLIGGGSGTPSFGTVPTGAFANGSIPTGAFTNASIPNSALINNSITVIGGSNISVSGSPVSLGGTVTIAQTAPVTVIPGSVLQVVDDFISDTVQGALNWEAHNMAVSSNSTAAHPGNLTAFGSPLTSYMQLQDNYPIKLGGGVLTINWVISLVTLSSGEDTYIFDLGMFKDATSSIGNGCYFEYTDSENSGKWTINCANATTFTTLDSGILADTGYHNFQIQVNSTATAVHFYIDGVETSNSPISTNIPTGNNTPALLLTPTGDEEGTPFYLVDLFYMSYALTTPR